MNALKVVRERAQRSKDNDLKELISALYDNLLSLKEAVMRLTQENDELERRIAKLQHHPQKSEPELRQVGSCYFYFVGEKGPYCQACYDGEGKLTALSVVS
jgi:predicted RNase H-like nuclease (RuvC/YqgF family)